MTNTYCPYDIMVAESVQTSPTESECILNCSLYPKCLWMLVCNMYYLKIQTLHCMLQLCLACGLSSLYMRYTWSQVVASVYRCVHTFTSKQPYGVSTGRLYTLYGIEGGYCNLRCGFYFLGHTPIMLMIMSQSKYSHLILYLKLLIWMGDLKMLLLEIVQVCMLWMLNITSITINGSISEIFVKNT